jgi:hypothetical protein
MRETQRCLDVLALQQARLEAPIDLGVHSRHAQVRLSVAFIWQKAERDKRSIHVSHGHGHATNGIEEGVNKNAGCLSVSHEEDITSM